MNLSKDELVRLASSMKVNKKVLERKSKNELVEFITGIQIDKCSPKKIKSAVKKVYDCVKAKRIEFVPTEPEIPYFQPTKYQPISVPTPITLPQTQPTPITLPQTPPTPITLPQTPPTPITLPPTPPTPITLPPTLPTPITLPPTPPTPITLPPTPPTPITLPPTPPTPITIPPTPPTPITLPPTQPTPITVPPTPPTVLRGLEEEIMRHEAATADFKKSSQVSIDNALMQVSEIQGKIDNLELRIQSVPQSVSDLFEQQRLALIESNRESTKLLVVETVSELVDETVSRVALQLNKDVASNVESASKLAAQKSVDAVLNESVKISSSVQTAMDQRVSSVIQESLGNVNRQILDIKSSLYNLDSLSLNISSLEFQNNNLQQEIGDVRDVFDSKFTKVSNELSVGLQDINFRLDQTEKNVEDSINSLKVSNQTQLETNITYIEEEVARTLSNYNLERINVDQQLASQMVIFRQDFDIVLRENNMFRSSVSEDILQQMRQYISENVTQRQLIYERNVDQILTRFPLESSFSQLLQQIQNPDFSAAAIDSLFDRMRRYVREQFGNRQLEFEPRLNGIESENQRLNQRITETERNINTSLQQLNSDVANVSRQNFQQIEANRSDFSEAAAQDLFDRMRQYILEQFGNRQLEFEPRLNGIESENQRLNQRITETERNINTSLQQLNSDVANVSRQNFQQIEANRSDVSEAAAQDLFARMRKYVREQFGNRQLEFEPRLNSIESENQRLNQRITDTERSFNTTVGDIVSTTNQSIERVNTISQNVSEISNDISDINDAVALSNNNIQRALSIIPTVNQLAIEMPKDVSNLQNKVAKLEASEVRISENFVALNNVLKIQRDAINQRLEMNSRILDEIRSNNPSVLAIESSTSPQVERQSLAIIALENRVTELESTIVSFDARIKQLQLLLISEDRPRPRKRRAV